MNYIKITYPDVENGLGCRVTLWVSGCSHHCKGCHNPATWKSGIGNDFNKEAKNELFNILKLPYIKGLTLSGGDPIESYEDVLNLVKEVKKEFQDKDIWLYTGYTLDYLSDNKPEILDFVDYIVDGEFVLELRDITLRFRGSSNQVIWEKNNNEWVKSELNE